MWRQLQAEGARLFIPIGAANILQRFAHFIEVRAFLTTVETLGSGRYLKRWGRRLHQHGFTREDALVLALATYGTDSEGNVRGVDVLITLDRLFLNNFRNHRAKLRTRLSAMTRQLPMPYYHATLPTLLHPEKLVSSKY